MPKWISSCYADHAVEKSFLVAQPLQLVAQTSQEASSVQAVAAIANDESLLVRVRKAFPPRREVISAPFGIQRCQNGVCPNLEKCCVIAKALSCCAQGPCETGETVDLS